MSQRVKYQRIAAFLAWKIEALASTKGQLSALSALRLEQKRDLLAAWRHTVLQQAQLIERLPILMRSRHLHTSCKAFRAWRALTVDSSKQKRRAENHLQDKVLVRGMAAWGQQAVAGKHEQRELRNLDSKHWKLRMLSCSFQGFRANLNHCHRIERFVQNKQEAKKEEGKVWPHS